MKLQQYITSFSAPLESEDARPLLRLLAIRNKTARGLSDTVGAIDVSSDAQLRAAVNSLCKERRLANPPHNLPEPWDGIALRHCACVHALYNQNLKEA